MEISCSAENGLEFAKLDIFFLELLRQIPVSADAADCEAAHARLFSKPGKDERAIADWQELIEPELRESFASALEVVRQDLEHFEAEDDSGFGDYKLRVPAAHFDGWLNALNQARLTLAARFDFTDEELAATEPPSLHDTRQLSLFQIHFYGFIQEFLVRELSGE